MTGIEPDKILGKGDGNIHPFFGHKSPMLSDLIFQNELRSSKITIYIEKEKGPSPPGQKRLLRKAPDCCMDESTACTTAKEYSSG